jgi:hypothetical protein
MSTKVENITEASEKPLLIYLHLRSWKAASPIAQRFYPPLFRSVALPEIAFTMVMLWEYWSKELMAG